MPRRKIFTVSLLFFGVVGLGCSHTGGHARRFKSYPRGLQNRGLVSLPGVSGGSPRFDVPVVVNDRVLSQLNYLLRDKDRFSRYLARSSRYENWMKKILREEGVPQDIFYLAMIESGFSNHALSRARALGPWQFIRSTGHIFNLASNYWVDERKDPEKSTRAAARYLKHLYNRFGHWYLAMAAYNAGEGKIQRAIQASGSRNFWVLSAPGSSYLKQETKDYVPRFLAAALIAKMPQRFGFRYVFYDEPFSFDKVAVDGPLDLTVAADLAGATAEELVYLNPELNQFMTPPVYYHLRVPEGRGELFKTAYADLPFEKRQAKKNLVYYTSQKKTFRYQVKKGDHLTRIARKLGVSVVNLKKENRIRSNGIRVGQRLKITKTVSVKRPVLLAYNETMPRRERMDGVEWLIQKNQMQEKEETDLEEAGEGAEEEVEVFEEVPVDARRENGATEEEVEEADLAKESSPVVYIPPMEKAAEPSPKEAASWHKVSKGESLWHVSKKYGVRVDQIKQWNNMKGDTLPMGKTIRVSGTRVSETKASPARPDKKASAAPVEEGQY